MTQERPEEPPSGAPERAAGATAEDGAGTASTPSPPATPPDAEASSSRHTRTILIAIAVAVGVLAIAAGVFWFVYATVAARLQAEQDLARAIELVEQADEVVIAADDVIQAEVTPLLASEARDVHEQIPGAQAQLDEAVELLDGAYEELTEEDREVADALRDSAEARQDMLVEADVLLEANAKAAAAIGPAEDAVDALLAAEDLSEQAVERFNEHGEEGVTASKELTNQAIAKLNESKGLFEEAQEAFPEAGLGPFVEYIDARIALLQQSVTIDETWLAGGDDNIEKANELLVAYAAEEEKVSALAEELPSSETEPIAAAYAEMTEGAEERYFEARERAIEADARLRELLGEEES
jgi:hypothetical protein